MELDCVDMEFIDLIELIWICSIDNKEWEKYVIILTYKMMKCHVTVDVDDGIHIITITRKHSLNWEKAK